MPEALQPTDGEQEESSAPSVWTTMVWLPKIARGGMLLFRLAFCAALLSLPWLLMMLDLTCVLVDNEHNQLALPGPPELVLKRSPP